MTPTLITPEFEKALARACMKAANQHLVVEPFRCGDASAVLCGARLAEIAAEAGMSIPQARRRMRALLEQGRVITNETSGSWTRWWLVGLAEAARAATADGPAPAPAPPRQTVTPAAVPARQHWSEALGVARDCSTSEARDAFRRRIDAIPEHDLDAEQQRQRIRDAYNARLTEDGISEFE